VASREREEPEPVRPRRAPPPPTRGGGDRERAAKIGLVVGANAGGVWLLIGYLTGHLWLGLALFLLALGTYLLAYRWDLVHDRVFLTLWVGVAVVGAVVSLVGGPLNGLTDEPFITPAFASAWPNLYGPSVSVSYLQYGHPLTTPPLYDVYLPLLAFVKIPLVSYKWTALAAWLGSLYLLRHRHEAVVLWGGFWVGVMAANGFNDYVPFLVLTLTFVSLSGPWAKVAEIVGLALKQFANVIIVVVHLYHRRWGAALLAVVVTAAILAPFAYLSPGGVWCHVVLIDPTGCGGGAGPVFGVAVLSHLNYPLWVLFAAAVFGAGFVRDLRAAPPGGWRGRAGELVRRYAPGRPASRGAPAPHLGAAHPEPVAHETLLELARGADQERLQVHRVRAVVPDQALE